MSRLVAKAASLAIGANGDVIRLRNGKREDFHIISPEADSEELRMVGALGEMLCEQIKKTFGLRTLLLVSQSGDSKLVMFPCEEGFTIWKTSLDFPRIISAMGADKENP